MVDDVERRSTNDAMRSGTIASTAIRMATITVAAPIARSHETPHLRADSTGAILLQGGVHVNVVGRRHVMVIVPFIPDS